MVDDQVQRRDGVYLAGVLASPRDRVPHRGEVHDQWDARVVLEQDPVGHERKLRAHAPRPLEQPIGGLRGAFDPLRVADGVLEQYPDRVGESADVVPSL